MAREGSKADQGLLAALEARGVKGVTPRKLERWRQGGLIPRAKRRGLGRHRGTVSVLPDGVADHVEAAAKAVAHYRSISRALMALFADGWSVDEWALKAAYVRNLEGAAIWLEAQGPEDSDSLTRPEAGAQSMVDSAVRTEQGRVWLRRLSGREESAASVLSSAIAAILHIFQSGYSSSEEALEEALTAGGVDRLWRDQLKGVGAVVTNKDDTLNDVAEMLATAESEGWVATIEQATWEDLKNGLQAVRSLAGLFKRLSAMSDTLLSDNDALGFGVFEGLDLDDPQQVASYALAIVHLRQMMGGNQFDQTLNLILDAGDGLNEAETLLAEASADQLDEARRLAHGLLTKE